MLCRNWRGLLQTAIGNACWAPGWTDDLKTVLPMVTTSPARAMGLEGYGVAVGNKADLVLLDTKVVEHAIIDIPERLYVIKNGRVTVKTDKKVEIIR